MKTLNEIVSFNTKLEYCQSVNNELYYCILFDFIQKLNLDISTNGDEKSKR